MKNVNRLRVIQIPSKGLKKDAGTQVNNSTFIFIADKVFGFPVYILVMQIAFEWYKVG